MSGTGVAHVLHLCILECDEDLAELVNQGILPLHPFFMHLEALVVLSEAVLMPFLPDLETFKVGFDYWMEGGALVEGGSCLDVPA